MPATLVPTIKTSYKYSEIIKGLIEGWKNQFGEYPAKKSIGVIYAQNAIETGATGSMWNNNIGNFKFVASKNPEDDNGKEYMMLHNVWEIINGQKIIYQPPHVATWFRSFPTLASGIAFHLDVLKNRRYKTAWVAVEAGDVYQFAHLLKEDRYYTAPEADYAKTMNLYFNKFMNDQVFENIMKDLVPPPPTPQEIKSPSIIVNIFSKFFRTSNKK